MLHLRALRRGCSRCCSSTRGAPSWRSGGSSPAAGRSVSGTPWQWLWIEMAAWWPCSTAQMMFSGPQAASPPKKTPARVDLNVVLSTVGHVPLVELDADVALDPGEGVLLPDGEDHVVGREEDRRSSAVERRLPLSSSFHSSFSNFIPLSLPFSSTNALRRVVDDDLDLLLLGVLELPRRGLEVARAACAP